MKATHIVLDPESHISAITPTDERGAIKEVEALIEMDVSDFDIAVFTIRNGEFVRCEVEQVITVKLEVI